MEQIFISDRTLKQTDKKMRLSFKEKIELSMLLDRLEVDTIELPPIKNRKVDSLLIKSVSSAVRHAEIAVPVDLNAESVSMTWNALKEAPGARLQVCAPVSSVQMEYLFHMKPDMLSARIADTIRECRKYTDRVEFIAEDAIRGDHDFLIRVVQEAIGAGASHVSFQEAAGSALPEEIGQEIERVLQAVGAENSGVVFGIDCSDELSLADACAVETVRFGIREIKAAAFAINCANLSSVARILSVKGEKLNAFCQVHLEEIRRVTSKIEAICRLNCSAPALFGENEPGQDSEVKLEYHDPKESVLHAIGQLGYLLGNEDQEKVYQAFLKVAEKKDSISMRELDALVAAEALQVPPAYQVIRFVVNTGNEIGAMAHMKLRYQDRTLDGISTGDGVIDAAFLALEKAVGRHFELDDFQIQAVTEGREAMGETVVRLRSQGKLYSGRGISTDIVGASIMAYVSALNKIVYEEEEE